MIESGMRKQMWPWGASRPAPVLCMVSAVLMVLVAGLSDLLFGAFILSVSVFGVISALALRGIVRSYPHDVLGACNIVTAVRAALLAVLAGAIVAPASGWAIFGIAAVAFALDGVDGWLARRSGLASAFGARFDMETDAALGAVLALVLLAGGTVGPAILVLGFSRYVYVMAGFVWPALQGDLTESFRRKAVCVVQIAALIILLCPLTPAIVVMPVSVGAAIALLYSFGVDAFNLLRRPA